MLAISYQLSAFRRTRSRCWSPDQQLTLVQDRLIAEAGCNLYAPLLLVVRPTTALVLAISFQLSEEQEGRWSPDKHLTLVQDRFIAETGCNLYARLLLVVRPTAAPDC